MSVIFITSFHPLLSRNILATPLTDMLAHKDVRIVIVCPERKRAFFEEQCSRDDVCVEGVPTRLYRRDRLLRALSLAALSTRTLSLKRRAEYGVVARILHLAFAWRGGRAAVRMLSALLTPRARFDALFERYAPALMFATDVQNELDVSLMHSARARKIPVVGMVRSWDNLTAKGLVRRIPDRLVVHNEIERREAETLHGVAHERMSVVGIPHYDRYVAENFSPVSTKASASFLRSIGAEPEKRLVLFAPAGDRYLGACQQTDRTILKLLDERLPRDCHILVRLPIADSVHGIEPGRFGRVTVEHPGTRFGHRKNTELSAAEDEHFARSVSLSSLVVAGPSTVCIDAACFDKPVILVGFDGGVQRPYDESIRRYYDYDHFAPVLRSGGVVLAESAEQFAAALRSYLADPSLDRAGRRRMIEEQAWRLDGRASERLAEVLLGAI